MNRGPAELELVVAELDCADEAAQIEGALGRLPAVTGVRTSVGAHKVFVTYDPAQSDPARIRATIESLGMTVGMDQPAASARRTPLSTVLGGLFVTAVALVALVGILGERLGLVEAVTERLPPWLTLAAVLIGGFPIFRAVVRALRNRTVTSHALMTLGILGALAIGQYAAAAVIVFFMRFADFLEGFTTERSRQAIRELLRLAPETARVEQDGLEVEVPADTVRPGQVVLVKSGERIPVDGRVADGHGSGQSGPHHRRIDAGREERGRSRLRRDGARARASFASRPSGSGAETTFGRILRLVEEAETHKAPVQRFADRFTAYYIPVVVGAALLTYLLGRDPSAAVAVVLVACSCAIAMATPTVVLASVGRAARRGLIVKGGRSLEALAKVDTAGHGQDGHRDLRRTARDGGRRPRRARRSRGAGPGGRRRALLRASGRIIVLGLELGRGELTDQPLGERPLLVADLRLSAPVDLGRIVDLVGEVEPLEEEPVLVHADRDL